MADLKQEGKQRFPWVELVAALATAGSILGYMPQRLGGLEERMNLIDRRQVRQEEVMDRIAAKMGIRTPPREETEP